jgi:hypothetical protein
MGPSWPTKTCRKLPWGHLGLLLGSHWPILGRIGPSGTTLGTCAAPIGAIWAHLRAHLGVILAYPGAILAYPRPPGPIWGGHLRPHWGYLGGHLGAVVGPFGGHLGPVLGLSWAIRWPYRPPLRTPGHILALHGPILEGFRWPPLLASMPASLQAPSGFGT